MITVDFSRVNASLIRGKLDIVIYAVDGYQLLTVGNLSIFKHCKILKGFGHA